MFVKQIGMAILAATILASGAAVANAESNVSGIDGGFSSESSLQSYANSIPFTSSGPYAYGYAGESQHLRSHARPHARVRHNS
jgi:hypothetical protein